MKMSRRVTFVHIEDDEKTTLLAELVKDDEVRVNLGFLKSWHLYRIEVALPASIVDSPILNNLTDAENGLFCKFECVSDDPIDGKKLIVLLNTVDKGYFADQIVFSGAGCEMQFLFDASVLGEDDGTPLLKDGIHLLKKLVNPNRDD